MLFNCYKTERLIIRDMLEEDAKAVFEIWSNEANEEYMSDPVSSEEEIKSFCIENKKSDNHNYLAVATLKETGEIIGTCCFGRTNKGYATEIVKSIIAFGRILGIKDFVSSCATENIASAKVMEKSGMKFDHISSFTQKGTNIVFEDKVYTLHIE